MWLTSLHGCEGWEIKPVTAKEYWADVPLEMRARMHYYNVPCDTAPDSPFNPLNIVKNMYRPGDFVVIKLDIDNEGIEQVSLSSLKLRNGILQWLLTAS